MPHSKSPVSSSAARLRDIRPSAATWALFFYDYRDESFYLEDVGQFITGLYANSHDKGLYADFVRTYGWRHESPYEASELGVLPFMKCERWNPDGSTKLPPSQEEVEELDLGLVAHKSDPYTYWASSFVVKLQRAHVAVGCSPKAIRQLVREFTERNRRSGLAGHGMPYDEHGRLLPLLRVKRGD